MLFPLVTMLGCALQTRCKQGKCSRFTTKRKVTRKAIFFYFFQLTEFKWTHGATKNVFKLNSPRHRGRNKHARHARFCYSFRPVGFKMEQLWRILHLCVILMDTQNNICFYLMHIYFDQFKATQMVVFVNCFSMFKDHRFLHAKWYVRLLNWLFKLWFPFKCV